MRTNSYRENPRGRKSQKVPGAKLRMVTPRIPVHLYDKMIDRKDDLNLSFNNYIIALIQKDIRHPASKESLIVLLDEVFEEANEETSKDKK